MRRIFYCVKYRIHVRRGAANLPRWYTGPAPHGLESDVCRSSSLSLCAYRVCAPKARLSAVSKAMRSGICPLLTK